MKLRLLAAASAMLLVAACTSDGSGDGRDAVAYPGKSWARVDAKDAGFDTGKLTVMDSYLATAGSSCFAVVRDGRVVHDAYWQGATATTQKPAYSVSKSVTSLLVGIAADEGKLSLDDKASKYIPQWRGTAADAVTIRNLLANDSGRHWDVTTDYVDMVAKATDKTAFSIGLAQDAAPGTVWNYNNSAIATLSAVLREATGVEPAAYAQEKLFGPLGMGDTTWPPDPSGHTETFSGVQSSCLDLARVGWLALRKGEWKGDQVVPRSYVTEATGKPSTDLNASYGLLWWLNDKGRISGATSAAGAPGSDQSTIGQLAPHAPKDAFWAIGAGQQLVSVVPSKGIVAVRMGAAPPAQTPVNPDNFTAAVLDAMK